MLIRAWFISEKKKHIYCVCYLIRWSQCSINQLPFNIIPGSCLINLLHCNPIHSTRIPLPHFKWQNPGTLPHRDYVNVRWRLISGWLFFFVRLIKPISLIGLTFVKKKNGLKVMRNRAGKSPRDWWHCLYTSMAAVYFYREDCLFSK